MKAPLQTCSFMLVNNFKQISTRLLDILRSNPALVVAVLDLERETLDTPFGAVLVDGRTKKALDLMNQAERENLYQRNAAIFNRMISSRRQTRLMERHQRKEEGLRRNLDELGVTREDSIAEISIEGVSLGLNLLLSGEMWPTRTPLGSAIDGGTKIGDELECGSSATFLTASEVCDVARALLQISEKDLVARLDSGAIDYELVAPGDVPHLLRGFAAIRGYYEDAAFRGNAMLLYETW
jgi:hypothetical protein